MTIQEFDNQKWTNGMKCFYMNKEYTIFGVDFEFSEISLIIDTYPEWISCKLITLINK